MRKLAIPAVVLLVAFATVPAAQQQPPPTFRSGVQLIEVDARVFDKEGKFVADLTKDDFEVIEDGVTQVVDAVFLVSGPGGLVAADTPAAPAAAGAAAAAPVAPQIWIFFFDLNHLTSGVGFERARDAVARFVEQGFREGDLAGIIAGDGMVNNRLTSVRDEILAAVKQVKPRADARAAMTEITRQWPRFIDEEEIIRVSRNERDVIDRVINRACADDPSYCERDPRAPETEVMMKGQRLQQEMHRRTAATLTSLNALASGLARVPGPKTVVMLSAGFVSMDVESTVRSVVGQTARAGGRVYAIDVRGLDRSGGSDIIDRTGFAEDPAGTLANEVPKFDMAADGMNSLAIDTGGMMIRNENNISRGLDRIAEDAGTYYVLAYQPANTNFDGKYRPIEVRVKRAGLRVRARKGYLALEPSRMTIPRPITAPPLAPEPDGPAPSPPFEPPAPPEWPTAIPGLPALPAASRPAATATRGVRTGAAGSAAEPGVLRMRPDAGKRIRELSGGETSSATALAAAGWAAYQHGDIEEAIGPLSEAARQPDVRPWVLYALGLSQGALGQPREAIVTWERVRQAAPEFAPVYIDLAATHASLSDLTQALAVLRDAEQRWPRDPEVLNAIGVVHFRRGALDEAIDAFTKAAVAAPDDALAHLNLGRAYELRFTRSRRYVTSQRRWVVDEGDRRKAAEHYQHYVRIGGPYVNAATDGLQRLEWSK